MDVGRGEHCLETRQRQMSTRRQVQHRRESVISKAQDRFHTRVYLAITTNGYISIGDPNRRQFVNFPAPAFDVGADDD